MDDTDIRRMQNLMEKAGHKPIDFEFTAFVTASFDRGVTLEKNDTSAQMDEGLKSLLNVIFKNPEIQARQASVLLDNRPVKTLKNQINALTRKGLIERRGSKKNRRIFYKRINQAAKRFSFVHETHGCFLPITEYDRNKRYPVTICRIAPGLSRLKILWPGCLMQRGQRYTY